MTQYVLWSHASVCFCVCLCVCVSLSAAIRPHYCTDLDVTREHSRGCPLVVQFAIGARVTLLRQDNANPSYELASILRYDIVQMLGGVCARCWPVTGGWPGVFSKLHAVYGKWAWLTGLWLAFDLYLYFYLLLQPWKLGHIDLLADQ